MHPNNIIVRMITEEDLAEVALVHYASFHDRALSQLGLGSVRRYYHWLLTEFSETYPICAVAAGEQLAGFCFMGVYAGSFSGFLANNKWFLVGAVLRRPWLITDPLVRGQTKLALKTILRILMNRKKNANTPAYDSARDKIKYSSLGILSIGVDPAFQRRGVGEMLMQRAEATALENGYYQLHLSVHTDNLPAVRFYEKMGWEKNINQGVWDGKMYKRLDS